MSQNVHSNNLNLSVCNRQCQCEALWYENKKTGVKQEKRPTAQVLPGYGKW